MAEYCTECKGTGKIKRIVCLHCAGTGIEPEQKPAYKIRYFGPFHTYPGLKRDFIFTVGLIILLLLLKMVSS